MGMEPQDWEKFKSDRAQLRKSKKMADKDMAGWAYDGTSGYYALVQRKNGELNVLAVSRDKEEITRVGRENGIKKAEELKFGTHRKDQITGGKMFTEGLKAIAERTRIERIAEENRNIATLSPETAELRAMYEREVSLENAITPNPDPQIEIRRDRAITRMHGHGYPTSGLNEWTVEQLEEFVTHLDVNRMAAERKPEVDLEPKTEGLEAKLKAAAMDHMFDEGPDVDPPDVDPPTSAPDPEPEPTPQMPGGTGEAMEPQPDLEAHPVTDPTPVIDVPRFIEEALPDMSPEDRAETQAYLEYAKRLESHVETSPDPEATKTAALVMRSFPTTNTAVDKTPSKKLKSGTGAPTPKLAKRLKK